MRRALLVSLGTAIAAVGIRFASAQDAAGVVVYSANRSDGTVSVLDGSTMAQVVPDFAAGDSIPNCVSVSPDGARVYVATSNGSTVAVIDAATNTLVTNVNVGDYDQQPNDLCVSPDGKKVFVTLELGRKVAVVDTENLVELTTFDVPVFVSDDPTIPTAIDILPNGSAIFVLNANPSDPSVVKLSTTDGTPMGGTVVSATAVELKVSVDGTRFVVVGSDAPQFFDTSDLSPIAGQDTDDIGTHLDVAVAGGLGYLLNYEFINPNLPPAKPGPKHGESDAPTIDVFDMTTGKFVKTVGVGTGADVLGIAVRSDGSTAYVSRNDVWSQMNVMTVDLSSGVFGPTGDSGEYPVRLALRETETPVDSYFLPRSVVMKLLGAGKDVLQGSGFYDDGGRAVDYGDEVTIDIGGYQRKFTLVPNKTRTTYRFKADDIKCVFKPNHLGSSRGKFKMRLQKTTLQGLVEPDDTVDFHFSGTGLSDASGRVELTAGRYRIGKKRGALLYPPFFPALLKAKVGAADADGFTFRGGFATLGQTPAGLGAVRFDLGPDFSRTVLGTDFNKTGDVFKFKAPKGRPKFSIVLNFAKETVLVKGAKVELGGLDTPTIDIVFDAGAGKGAIRNTVRLGSSGPNRTY